VRARERREAQRDDDADAARAMSRGNGELSGTHAWNLQLAEVTPDRLKGRRRDRNDCERRDGDPNQDPATQGSAM